jgi:Fe-S-cluster containining protein
MTSCPSGQNACGSCCDPVVLHFDPAEMIQRRLFVLDTWDPGTEEGWEHWLAKGYEDNAESRAHCMDEFREDSQGVRNARFMKAYWTVREAGVIEEGEKTASKPWLMTCAKFNTHTRACEAYDERPPICSDYPWYGEEPSTERADNGGLTHVCAYQDDVPGRRVLPIVSIREGVPV